MTPTENLAAFLLTLGHKQILKTMNSPAKSKRLNTHVFPPLGERTTVRSMYRDSDDESRMEKWRVLASTMETEYVVCNNDNDLYLFTKILKSLEFSVFSPKFEDLTIIIAPTEIMWIGVRFIMFYTLSLSTPLHFFCGSDNVFCFFLIRRPSKNPFDLRQSVKADSDAMFLTTLQKVFSVLNHKTRLEKIQGEMSNLVFQILKNVLITILC